MKQKLATELNVTITQKPQAGSKSRRSMKNYRIAGILLKAAFILQLFYIGVLNPAMMQAFDNVAVIIMLVVSFLFYLFAHFVQSEKTLTKYPLLVITLLSLATFVIGAIAFYRDWIWMTSSSLIHMLMVVATILVLKAKPIADEDPSNEPLLDHE